MRSRRRGFTLIELLTVLAIIGLLASIALPRFMRARDKATYVGCGQNLKNIATALQSYAVDHQAVGQQCYPDSLAELVPSYLSAFPTCPSAAADTYTDAYAFNSFPAQFTVLCSGSSHWTVDGQTDVPWYNVGEGLGPK